MSQMTDTTAKSSAHCIIVLMVAFSMAVSFLTIRLLLKIKVIDLGDR